MKHLFDQQGQLAEALAAQESARREIEAATEAGTFGPDHPAVEKLTQSQETVKALTQAAKTYGCQKCGTTVQQGDQHFLVVQAVVWKGEDGKLRHLAFEEERYLRYCEECWKSQGLHSHFDLDKLQVPPNHPHIPNEDCDPVTGREY